nr:substrate-binding domain-containing protein [Rhodoferax sp.]
MSIIRRLVAAVAVLAAFGASTSVFAEELVVPGSGNPEYVLKVLAEAFNAQQALHRVLVPTSIGTAGGLREVEAGRATLGRVGRPLKSDELARGLVYIPIGRDPVTFVGGAGVTVKDLTQAQLIDAYTGRATNWQAFGGKPSPIRVIGRESTDTSRQAINRVIQPFDHIVFGDAVKVVSFDPQMIELLDRFPGSLGFLNRSALAAAKTKLVYLSLDGVPSTPQNVGAGRYPLWLEFGFIHKSGKLGPAAKAFVDFVSSPAGVRILREQGVLAAAAKS